MFNEVMRVSGLIVEAQRAGNVSKASALQSLYDQLLTEENPQASRRVIQAINEIECR